MPPKVEIPDSPGSTIGAYTVATKLSDGELGALLAVRTDGGQGALCMMRQIEGSAEVVARLARAARAAVGIEHEHLLAIQAVIEGQDKVAIVSEYCEGEALGTLLRAASVRRVHITTPVALRVVLDLLKGLTFAHEQKESLGGSAELRHGGLAPSSIFVGSDGVTRLMDLGASGVAARSEPWTKDGKWIAYASPEAVKLGKELGPEADVFTAGVLLWEMLQNKRLFSGLTYAAVATKVLEQKVGRVDVGRPDAAGAVSATLGDVVSRALERDVTKRFRTAADMAAAIKQCGDRVADSAEVADWVEDLAGRTITATRSSLSQALGRSKSNAPPSVDAIAPLDGGATRPAPVPRKSGPPPGGPPKPPPKKRPPDALAAEAGGAPERKGPPRKPAPARPPTKPEPREASVDEAEDEPGDMQEQPTLMVPADELLAAAEAAAAKVERSPKPAKAAEPKEATRPPTDAATDDEDEDEDEDLGDETDDGEWAARARDRARIRAALKPLSDGTPREANDDEADEHVPPEATKQTAPPTPPAAKATGEANEDKPVVAKAKAAPAAPAAAEDGKSSKLPWIVAAVLALAVVVVLVTRETNGDPPAEPTGATTTVGAATAPADRTDPAPETTAPSSTPATDTAPVPTAEPTAGATSTAAVTAAPATTKPAGKKRPPDATTQPTTTRAPEPKATATAAPPPPPPPPPGTAPPKYQPGDL